MHTRACMEEQAATDVLQSTHIFGKSSWRASIDFWILGTNDCLTDATSRFNWWSSTSLWRVAVRQLACTSAASAFVA